MPCLKMLGSTNRPSSSVSPSVRSQNSREPNNLVVALGNEHLTGSNLLNRQDDGIRVREQCVPVT